MKPPGSQTGRARSAQAVRSRGSAASRVEAPSRRRPTTLEGSMSTSRSRLTRKGGGPAAQGRAPASRPRALAPPRPLGPRSAPIRRGRAPLRRSRGAGRPAV